MYSIVQQRLRSECVIVRYMNLHIERTDDLKRIADMRFAAYQKYLINERPCDLTDNNDKRRGAELYVACKGTDPVGSFRLNFGTPLPHETYWPTVISPTGGMEISRMTVDPMIINPAVRYRIIYNMLGRAAERAIKAGVNDVYTTAIHSLAVTYSKLLGFQFAGDGPRNIPPGKEEIYLLRLQMTEKVVSRAKKAFSI